MAGCSETMKQGSLNCTAEGGGELTLAAMEEYERMEIGRKTYRFVRRVMRDPALRAIIKARAAELERMECSA